MSTTKLNRKEQKIADQKAALRKRVTDILLGASGGYEVDPDIGVMSVFDLESLSRWIGALENSLPYVPSDQWSIENPDKAREQSKYAFQMCNLKHFDQVATAVDHLFSYGFRAGE